MVQAAYTSTIPANATVSIVDQLLMGAAASTRRQVPIATGAGRGADGAVAVPSAEVASLRPREAMSVDRLVPRVEAAGAC